MSIYETLGVETIVNAKGPATRVGGGIMAIVPGQMAIVAFSPPLSTTGNSVRAMRVIEHISKDLDLNIFSR